MTNYWVSNKCSASVTGNKNMIRKQDCLGNFQNYYIYFIGKNFLGFAENKGNLRNKIPSKKTFLTPAKIKSYIFYLFISTDDYNILQHNIKQSLIEYTKMLYQSFSHLSTFVFNPFRPYPRKLIPVKFEEFSHP